MGRKRGNNKANSTQNKPNREDATASATSTKSSEPPSIFESVTLPTITVAASEIVDQPSNSPLRTPSPPEELFTPHPFTLNKHTQATRSISRLDVSTPRVNLSRSFNMEASPCSTPSNMSMANFSLSEYNPAPSSFGGLGKVPIYEDNQIDELRKNAYHVRVGTRSIKKIPSDHPVLMGSMIKGSFEVPDHVITAVHRVLRSKQQLVRRSKFFHDYIAVFSFFNLRLPDLVLTRPSDEVLRLVSEKSQTAPTVRLDSTDPSLLDVSAYHLGTRDVNNYLKSSSFPSPPLSNISGFSTPCHVSAAPTPTHRPGATPTNRLKAFSHEPTTSPAPVPFPSAGSLSLLHIPTNTAPSAPSTALPLSPSKVPPSDAPTTITHHLFSAPVSVRASAVDALIEAAGGPTPALVSLTRLRSECAKMFDSFEQLTHVVKVLTAPYRELKEPEGEQSDVFHGLPAAVTENGPSVPPTPLSSTGYAISYDDDENGDKLITRERGEYYNQAKMPVFRDLLFSPLKQNPALFDKVMALIGEDINLYWERYVLDKKGELYREIRARKEKKPYKPRGGDGTASVTATPVSSAPSTPLHRGNMTPFTPSTPSQKGMPSPAYTPASFFSHPSSVALPAPAQPSTPSASYQPSTSPQSSPTNATATTFYRNRVHNRRPLPLTFAQLVKQQYRLTQLRLAVAAAIKLEAAAANTRFSSLSQQDDAFVMATGADTSSNDIISTTGSSARLCVRAEYIDRYSGCLFTPLPITMTYEDLHELCIGALGVLPLQRALNSLILGAKQHRLASISLRELGATVAVMAITMAVHSDVLLPVVRGSAVSALAAEDKEKALADAQGDIIKAITAPPVPNMDTFIEEEEEEQATGNVRNNHKSNVDEVKERPSLLQIATAAAEVAAIGTGLSVETQFYTQSCYLRSQGLSVPYAYVDGELTEWTEEYNDTSNIRALMVVEESVDPAEVVIEDIDLNNESVQVGDKAYSLYNEEEDDGEEDSSIYLQEYAATVGELRREIADKTASQLGPEDKNDWLDRRAMRKEKRTQKVQSGISEAELSPWESEHEDENVVFMAHRRARVSELRNLQKDLDKVQQNFGKKQKTVDFRRKELLRQRRAVVSSFKQLCSKDAIVTLNQKIVSKVVQPSQNRLMLVKEETVKSVDVGTKAGIVDAPSIFFMSVEPEHISAKYLQVISDDNIDNTADTTIDNTTLPPSDYHTHEPVEEAIDIPPTVDQGDNEHAEIENKIENTADGSDSDGKTEDAEFKALAMETEVVISEIKGAEAESNTTTTTTADVFVVNDIEATTEAVVEVEADVSIAASEVGGGTDANSDADVVVDTYMESKTDNETASEVEVDVPPETEGEGQGKEETFTHTDTETEAESVAAEEELPRVLSEDPLLGAILDEAIDCIAQELGESSAHTEADDDAAEDEDHDDVGGDKDVPNAVGSDVGDDFEGVSVDDSAGEGKGSDASSDAVCGDEGKMVTGEEDKREEDEQEVPLKAETLSNVDDDVPTAEAEVEAVADIAAEEMVEKEAEAEVDVEVEPVAEVVDTAACATPTVEASAEVESPVVGTVVDTAPEANMTEEAQASSEADVPNKDAEAYDAITTDEISEIGDSEVADVISKLRETEINEDVEAIKTDASRETEAHEATTEEVPVEIKQVAEGAEAEDFVETADAKEEEIIEEVEEVEEETSSQTKEVDEAEAATDNPLDDLELLETLEAVEDVEEALRACFEGDENEVEKEEVELGEEVDVQDDVDFAVALDDDAVDFANAIAAAAAIGAEARVDVDERVSADVLDDINMYDTGVKDADSESHRHQSVYQCMDGCVRENEYDQEEGEYQAATLADEAGLMTLRSAKSYNYDDGENNEGKSVNDSDGGKKYCPMEPCTGEYQSVLSQYAGGTSDNDEEDAENAAIEVHAILSGAHTTAVAHREASSDSASVPFHGPDGLSEAEIACRRKHMGDGRSYFAFEEEAKSRQRELLATEKQMVHRDSLPPAVLASMSGGKISTVARPTAETTESCPVATIANDNVKKTKDAKPFRVAFTNNAPVVPFNHNKMAIEVQSKRSCPPSPDTVSYGGALALLKSLNLLDSDDEEDLAIDW